MATRSVWKGFLNFGLVSIGVKMATAARDSHIELHKYHTECGGRIKMPTYCPACEKQLSDSEIEKGFESANGHVTITKAEIESITPASEKVMEIGKCVAASEVDPTYMAESFYLLPEDASKKTYSLLAQSLADSGRVAIAQITKSNREHVVLIRPKGNGLMAHFLFYDNEVNRVPEFEDLNQVKLTAAELKLARQLVDSLDDAFDPEEYENGYDQRLNTLIASKLDASGKTEAPKAVKPVATQLTPDITAALAASLKRKAGGGQTKAKKGKAA